MAKGPVYDGDMLKLLLNAAAIANVADNAAASPLTAISVALHTADPITSTAAAQGVNEVSATGYARVVTTRSTVGWTVTGATPATASPVSAVTFPQLTSTSTGTITHFSLGASSNSTAGKIFYSGTVTPNINYGQNTTPVLTTGSSVTED